jgi:tRNA pseudouridine55 synthase
VEYLVGQPKTYVTTVRLGQTTNTYDADGEVVAERPFSHITPDLINQSLAPYRGTIQQQPPLYSAIKKDGQPLYKLARRGEIVDVPPREVTIFELSLLAVNLPEIELHVTSSSGTYVRSLAHDLGEALGCGGHVVALRRTAVGNFTTQEAVPLATLNQANVTDFLLPMTTAVAHLPRLDLNAEETEDIQYGRQIARRRDQPEAELAQVFGADGRFVGIVTARNDSWQPHKIFHPMGE